MSVQVIAFEKAVSSTACPSGTFDTMITSFTGMTEITISNESIFSPSEIKALTFTGPL